MTIENTDALITPEEAEARRTAGALLIDVRSAQGQAANGLIDGAVAVSKADAPTLLDLASSSRLVQLSEDLDQDIVVFCGTENGSDPIVGQLRAQGFRNVHQIDGGVLRWVEEGRPTTPVDDADASQA